MLGLLLKDCHTLFKARKYESCCDNIRRLHEDSRLSSLSLLEKWCIDNNEIVSNFMLAFLTKADKKSSKKPTASTCAPLRNLLHKIKSVPSNVQILYLELSVLYNIFMVCLLQTSVHSVCVEEWLLQLTCETLQKVCVYHGRETEAINRSTEHLLTTAVNCCLQTDNKECLQPLLNLSYIWAIYRLLRDEPVEALSCLSYSSESLTAVEPACKADINRNTFIIPIGAILTGDHGNGDASNSDFVNFLCGIALYRSDFGRSFEHLRQVQCQCWLPYTKYMLAYIDYKNSSFVEALSHLSSLPELNTKMTNKLKAMYSYIFASCLTKLNKPYCAIQKYEEALQYDSTFLLPLYSISRQYHDLGHLDAELETLNLLVTTFEEQGKDHHSLSTMSSCLFHVIDEREITLVEALYILSHEYLSQRKYEAASQSYLDLLATLNDPTCTKIFGSARTSVITTPTLDEIYMETAYTLLKSAQYEDCIVVCDRMLSSSDPLSASVTFPVTQEDETDTSLTLPSSCDSGSSRKRSQPLDKGDNSVMLSTQSHEQINTMISLYKADALIYCGDIDHAVDTLDRLADRIAESADMIKSRDLESTSPKAKRQRISSDGSAVYTSSSKDCRRDTSTLSAEVYRHLGIALARQKNCQDALHYFRLSLQLNPKSMESLYNCTMALKQLDKHIDAAACWCRGRSMDITSDSFQIAKLLQQKKNIVRSQDNNVDLDNSQLNSFVDSVTEQNLLILDVQCLDALIKQKNKAGNLF